MLVNTVLTTLLPVIFTFLFGFAASRRHDFGSNDATTLNRMVLLYVVPLTLFAGTASTPRAVLSQGIPFLVVFCAVIIGLYGVVFSVVPCYARSARSVSADKRRYILHLRRFHVGMLLPKFEVRLRARLAAYISARVSKANG
jgi:Membrane transport protein